MRKKTALFLRIRLVLLFCACGVVASAQKISFTVSMPDPASQLLHVKMECLQLKPGITLFKLPVWTPGYYQKMNYPEQISSFSVTADGNSIPWEKAGDNGWQVRHKSTRLELTYTVKATRNFVAGNILDTAHAYLSPAGVFMHISQKIGLPSTVNIVPFSGWKDIATGLEPVAGVQHAFRAENFDILYDSPILIGNLEFLPEFTVKGILHRFIGYKMGDFDKAGFIQELQQIIVAATAMMKDIPYKEYTFIAIGPGGGGIEHLNSTSISFSGAGLESKAGRIRTLSFLAHEYFHHYNVKRIRPVELGPFDYDKGSRTKQLWISEGVTVYYEQILLRTAGLISADEMLRHFAGTMVSLERKPGRLVQSLEQSSFATWDEGPFGGDAAKSISYYEKGPLVALLFDLAIRNETKNRASLDDVMRTLYQQYYQQKKRGFSENEFRAVVTSVAGRELPDLFDYISTTKPLDYSRYLGYAGLQVNGELSAPGFSIIPVREPTPLQQEILKSWSRQ